MHSQSRLLAVAAAALGAAIAAQFSARGADEHHFPSSITVAGPAEPGERLVISGTIYLPDGITPAKDAILSVWQTDAKGYYGDKGGEAGELNPRLHGRLQTGADGKYEIWTIKPAPYPQRTIPAHIHAHLSAAGFPEYAMIYYFEGDPYITAANRAKLDAGRGGTPSIIRLERDVSGGWRGTRDIRLEHVTPDGQTMRLRW